MSVPGVPGSSIGIPQTFVPKLDCCGCWSKVFKDSHKPKDMVNIDSQVKLEHLISSREQSHNTETSVILLNGSIKTLKLLHLASKNCKFVWPSLM